MINPCDVTLDTRDLEQINQKILKHWKEQPEIAEVVSKYEKGSEKTKDPFHVRRFMSFRPQFNWKPQEYEELEFGADLEYFKPYELKFTHRQKHHGCMSFAYTAEIPSDGLCLLHSATAVTPALWPFTRQWAQKLSGEFRALLETIAENIIKDDPQCKSLVVWAQKMLNKPERIPQIYANSSKIKGLPEQLLHYLGKYSDTNYKIYMYDKQSGIENLGIEYNKGGKVSAYLLTNPGYTHLRPLWPTAPDAYRQSYSVERILGANTPPGSPPQSEHESDYDDGEQLYKYDGFYYENGHLPTRLLHTIDRIHTGLGHDPQSTDAWIWALLADMTDQKGDWKKLLHKRLPKHTHLDKRARQALLAWLKKEQRDYDHAGTQPTGIAQHVLDKFRDASGMTSGEDRKRKGKTTKDPKYNDKDDRDEDIKKPKENKKAPRGILKRRKRPPTRHGDPGDSSPSSSSSSSSSDDEDRHHRHRGHRHHHTSSSSSSSSSDDEDYYTDRIDAVDGKLAAMIKAEDRHKLQVLRYGQQYVIKGVEPQDQSQLLRIINLLGMGQDLEAAKQDRTVLLLPNDVEEAGLYMSRQIGGKIRDMRQAQIGYTNYYFTYKKMPTITYFRDYIEDVVRVAGQKVIDAQFNAAGALLRGGAQQTRNIVTETFKTIDFTQNYRQEIWSVVLGIIQGLILRTNMPWQIKTILSLPICYKVFKDHVQNYIDGRLRLTPILSLGTGMFIGSTGIPALARYLFSTSSPSPANQQMPPQSAPLIHNPLFRPNLVANSRKIKEEQDYSFAQHLRKKIWEYAQWQNQRIHGAQEVYIDTPLNPASFLTPELLRHFSGIGSYEILKMTLRQIKQIYTAQVAAGVNVATTKYSNYRYELLKKLAGIYIVKIQKLQAGRFSLGEAWSKVQQRAQYLRDKVRPKDIQGSLAWVDKLTAPVRDGVVNLAKLSRLTLKRLKEGIIGRDHYTSLHQLPSYYMSFRPQKVWKSANWFSMPYNAKNAPKIEELLKARCKCAKYQVFRSGVDINNSGGPNELRCKNYNKCPCNLYYVLHARQTAEICMYDKEMMKAYVDHGKQWIEQIKKHYEDHLDNNAMTLKEYLHTVEPQKRGIYKAGIRALITGGRKFDTYEAMVKPDEYHVEDAFDKARPRAIFDPPDPLKAYAGAIGQAITKTYAEMLPQFVHGLNSAQLADRIETWKCRIMKHHKQWDINAYSSMVIDASAHDAHQWSEMLEIDRYLYQVNKKIAQKYMGLNVVEQKYVEDRLTESVIRVVGKDDNEPIFWGKLFGTVYSGKSFTSLGNTLRMFILISFARQFLPARKQKIGDYDTTLMQLHAGDDIYLWGPTSYIKSLQKILKFVCTPDSAIGGLQQRFKDLSIKSGNYINFLGKVGLMQHEVRLQRDPIRAILGSRYTNIGDPDWLKVHRDLVTVAVNQWSFVSPVMRRYGQYLASTVSYHQVPQRHLEKFKNNIKYWAWEQDIGTSEFTIPEEQELYDYMDLKELWDELWNIDWSEDNHIAYFYKRYEQKYLEQRLDKLPPDTRIRGRERPIVRHGETMIKPSDWRSIYSNLNPKHPIRPPKTTLYDSQYQQYLDTSQPNPSISAIPKDPGEYEFDTKGQLIKTNKTSHPIIMQRKRSKSRRRLSRSKSRAKGRSKGRSRSKGRVRTVRFAKTPRRNRARSSTRVTVALNQAKSIKLRGPQYKQLSPDTLRIVHKEIIMDVRGSQTFALISNSMATTGWNVGLSSCFPWLAGIAAKYEYYKFNTLTLHYRSMAPATAIGQVMFQLDPDIRDSIPASKLDMMDSGTLCTDGQVWKDLYLTLKPKDLYSQKKRHLVRTGAVSGTITQADYDFGNVNIGVTNCADNTTVIGEIWLHYDVVLTKPCRGVNANNTLLNTETVDWQTVSTATPIAVADAQNIATMLKVTRLDANTLRFEQPFSGLFQAFVDGASLGSGTIDTSGSDAGLLTQIATGKMPVVTGTDYFNEWAINAVPGNILKILFASGITMNQAKFLFGPLRKGNTVFTATDLLQDIRPQLEDPSSDEELRMDKPKQTKPRKK